MIGLALVAAALAANPILEAQRFVRLDDGQAVVRIILSQPPEGFAGTDRGATTTVSVDGVVVKKENLLLQDGAKVGAVEARPTTPSAGAPSASVHRVILLLDRSWSMTKGASANPDCAKRKLEPCQWWDEARFAVDTIVKGLPKGVGVELAVAPFDCRFTRKGGFDFKKVEDEGTPGIIASGLVYPDIDERRGEATRLERERVTCTALYNAVAEAWAEAKADTVATHAYYIVVVSDGENDLRDAKTVAVGSSRDPRTGERWAVGGGFRPWCDVPWPDSHPFGWIAQYGARFASNDGAVQGCQGQAPGPSPLRAEMATYQSFVAAVAADSKPDNSAKLPIRCFGFHGADRSALDAFCTSSSDAADETALATGIVKRVLEDVMTLAVTIRVPAKKQDDIAHHQVKVAFGDGRTYEGELPAAFTGDLHDWQPTAEELTRFGQGQNGSLAPPAIRDVLIAFLAVFATVLATWLLVPRLLWARAERVP